MPRYQYINGCLLSILLCCWNTLTITAQTQITCLTNATIHVGNGTVITNGTISFSNGKINQVAGDAPIPDGATVLDMKGQHVYPGLIVPATHLGIQEIFRTRPTEDFHEIGDINPSIRTLSSYNTDSRMIGPLRSNGILLAQVIPEGELLAGSSSIVQLDAGNWEEAAYKTDNGMHLYIPRPNPMAPDSMAIIRVKLQQLKTFFYEAKAYLQQKQPTTVLLKYEALRPLFNKEQKLFVHCNMAREILAAINFTREFELPTVIVGGAESWRVADTLKALQIPVILASPYTRPIFNDDRADQRFRTAIRLQQAGVLFCFGPTPLYWLQRNVIFAAGAACAYGLDKEQALAALTLNTARILGIAAQTGSLEPGKDANIIVSKGDILDLITSNVTSAYIQGRQISLDDEQKQLYRKYNEKYNLR